MTDEDTAAVPAPAGSRRVTSEVDGAVIRPVYGMGNGRQPTPSWVNRDRVAEGPRVGRYDNSPVYPDYPPSIRTTRIRWLAREGRAIALADLKSFLAGRRALKDGAVLATMNDGFRSLLVEALPIVARHDIPAGAFVPAGQVGETLRRLQGSGS